MTWTPEQAEWFQGIGDEPQVISAEVFRLMQNILGCSGQSPTCHDIAWYTQPRSAKVNYDLPGSTEY